MRRDVEPRSGDGAALLESLLHDTGARWALTTAGLVATLLVLGVVRATPWEATLVVLGVAALLARGLPVVWCLATAVVAWALVTGFAFNDFGALTFTGPDVVRLLIFGCVVVLAGAATGGRRRPSR